VRYRFKIRCPSCLPQSRVCAECSQAKSLLEFGTAGGKVESLCNACRKGRQKAYYARKQQARPKSIPSHKRCLKCARTLKAKAFFEDHRYADGLTNECLSCHG
jgi:hypothetical protein